MPPIDPVQTSPQPATGATGGATGAQLEASLLTGAPANTNGGMTADQATRIITMMGAQRIATTMFIQRGAAPDPNNKTTTFNPTGGLAEDPKGSDIKQVEAEAWGS